MRISQQANMVSAESHGGNQRFLCLFLRQVEEIFTLSLSHLCNPQNRGYTHFRTGNRYGYTLPVFRNGKHRVWGLTAVALDHTLKLIVPQSPSQ